MPLARFEPTTSTTPPSTTPDIDATNCVTGTSPKKDVQEALILTTPDAVHIYMCAIISMFYPLSHSGNRYATDHFSGIYIYCAIKHMYNVYIRIRTYNEHGRYIFRCSVGCELMLMIKARIRLLFSRDTYLEKTIKSSQSEFYANASLSSQVLCCKHYISKYLGE